MNKLLLCLLCLLALACPASSASPTYAVATQAIPVFNRPADAAAPQAAKTDSCGQVRSLEFIALPGTVFTIISQSGPAGKQIFEVRTDDYRPPPGVRLYLASEHLRLQSERPPGRSRAASLRRDEVQRRLRSALGTPYVWGGNLRTGIVSASADGLYAGLDCSGLLYEATGGTTPRNTADLVDFGRAVPIAGRSIDQLAAELRPLDLLVWKGHVVIVLDNEQTIESILLCKRAGNGGVVTTPLRKRLQEIMRERTAADRWPNGAGQRPLFVVRRWIGSDSTPTGQGF